MPNKSLPLTPALYDYLLSVSLREPEVLKQLREETATLPGSIMQITPEQGQFMALLVELIHAKKILDIGTYTGYSSLVTALALPEDGTLITCDISKENTDVARRYWQQAGVNDKIELKLGEALDTLNQLIEQNDQLATFDFIFIDADKQNYHNSYERCLQLARPGGLIMLDNVLYGGLVTDENTTDKNAQFFREFNQFLLKDERVSISLLPIADGITLAKKR